MMMMMMMMMLMLYCVQLFKIAWNVNSRVMMRNVLDSRV